MSSLPPLAIKLAAAFLGGIPEALYSALDDVFRPLQLAQGEQLIKQGDFGDHLYIVLSGQLKVVDEAYGETGRVLEHKHVGDGVGEIALLTGERRTASVYATEQTELLSLSRNKLDEISQSNPQIADVIHRAITERIQRSRLNHVLRITEVFKNLHEDVLRDIQAKLQLVTVASGEVLMSADEPGDSLYVVLGGRLQVQVPSPHLNATYKLDVYRGQSVGEFGLISGTKRSATVVALRDSLLARLSKEAFVELTSDYPEAMLNRFVGPIIQRLRDQLPVEGRTSDESVRTIAVIPLNRNVDLNEFTTKLKVGLSSLGQTRRLDSHRCSELLGIEDIAYSSDDDPRNSRFVFWLNEQEVMHDYVVYEADYGLTNWTKRCLRQADLIALVGWADGNPALSEIEQLLLAHEETRSPAKCLVLLHDRRSGRPTGTARWLSQRAVRQHYHVRIDSEADFGRLARLLTGQGVGLVLSGGGARALSQIGVIRGLLEKNIPIDVVTGVSAGSIVAGLWAMLLDTAEAHEKAGKVVKRVDYTFPIYALTSGQNWTKAIYELYGEVNIEDLWTTFFCVSTNLTQATVQMHDSGLLMHGVRASTAVPGLLPPVFHEGDVLIDGGLVNNLPTDLMKNRPDVNFVIAVDVGVGQMEKVRRPFGYALSGWKALWQRMNPWSQPERVPTISDVIQWAIMIPDSQAKFSSRDLIDVYLKPPVRAYGLLDYNKVDQLVDIGYQYLRQQVIDWPNRPLNS